MTFFPKARLALMFWHINIFIMKGSAKWRKEEKAFQDIRPFKITSLPAAVALLRYQHTQADISSSETQYTDSY